MTTADICRDCGSEGSRLTDGRCDGCHELEQRREQSVYWLRAWPSGHVHAFPKQTHTTEALCGADPDLETATYPSYARACDTCWRLSGVDYARERPWHLTSGARA